MSICQASSQNSFIKRNDKKALLIYLLPSLILVNLHYRTSGGLGSISESMVKSVARVRRIIHKKTWDHATIFQKH